MYLRVLLRTTVGIAVVTCLASAADAKPKPRLAGVDAASREAFNASLTEMMLCLRKGDYDCVGRHVQLPMKIQKATVRTPQDLKGKIEVPCDPNNDETCGAPEVLDPAAVKDLTVVLRKPPKSGAKDFDKDALYVQGDKVWVTVFGNYVEGKQLNTMWIFRRTEGGWVWIGDATYDECPTCDGGAGF